MHRVQLQPQPRMSVCAFLSCLCQLAIAVTKATMQERLCCRVPLLSTAPSHFFAHHLPFVADHHIPVHLRKPMNMTVSTCGRRRKRSSGRTSCSLAAVFAATQRPPRTT